MSYDRDTLLAEPDVQRRRTSVGVLDAARAQWQLVAIPVVLFVIAAAALGLKRDPTYTAAARLSVGRIDVSAPGALAGFSAATQSLASTYSRAITAEGVVDPAARRLGVSRGTVRRALSASPVPNSPVFTVKAATSSRAGSIRTANAASAALIAYIQSINRANPDAGRLFRDFRTATLAFSRALATKNRLRAALGNSQNATRRAALDQASADADSALLRRETLRQAYQNSEQGQGSTALIQVLTHATGASSDRSSKLQLLLFLGAVAGLVVGLAIVTLRANWRLSRLH